MFYHVKTLTGHLEESQMLSLMLPMFFVVSVH